MRYNERAVVSVALLYQLYVLVVAVRPLHFEITNTKTIQVSDDPSNRLFHKKGDIVL